ncbi:MAG: MTH1187 family thiamine-binding protein [gamma proteobacterium endosymbiont of Lamellibrachia anaximandri]|nr:MTH1187 family thiamine-binding protein [gamma proteobacterium endosymbiont of Lamellibrachia anaximandri]MBL3533726.1 MTH1187 family thiamine-binding protein [gamma proteobacterium endosymbiont of Lamellibrachia anaximandri]MBL3600166.1 MTH1187 family thiamine-binding protein [gamma proteobacterium endosymbiont of Lamellibrachia anaximandri]
MSVLLEFSMFPTDRGESVSTEVSRIIRMIRESGINYRLTAMGTIIETGDIREALDLVEQAYRVLETQGCKRIYSSLKFDIRIGKDNRLEQKIRSVREKIGEVQQ